MTFIFRGPANKLLYGCTIDFTFTRPLFKRLWDCPWIPNLCAAHSLSSWHPLSSVNWRDYSLNRIALPFIPWTTGQSGRWQAGDSIQMEMKASGEWCCLSNTGESFWVKGVPADLPNWVLHFTYWEISALEIWYLTQLFWGPYGCQTYDLSTVVVYVFNVATQKRRRAIKAFRNPVAKRELENKI